MLKAERLLASSNSLYGVLLCWRSWPFFCRLRAISGQDYFCLRHRRLRNLRMNRLTGRLSWNVPHIATTTTFIARYTRPSFLQEQHLGSQARSQCSRTHVTQSGETGIYPSTATTRNLIIKIL